MVRTAKCHCGKFSVRLNATPTHIAMCHCQSCQRRTGSSYSLGALVEKSDVTVSGEQREYRRKGDLGHEVIFHFCPNCGSTVYWEVPDMIADNIVVAGGCFSDPAFPKPDVSMFGMYRHRWLTLPVGTVALAGDVHSENEA